VGVAQVPGRDFPAKHIAVILLSVAHYDRVLFGEEIGVRCHLAVSLQIFQRLSPQCDEFPHDGILASRRHTETRGVAIGFDFLAEMFEATVMLAGALRCFRVNFAQVSEDSLDRGMQTIQIESVKSAFPVLGNLFVVVFAQPADEIEHIGVSPHPLRETFEATQRFHAVDVRACAADETVDPIGVRPVCFHRHGIEAAFVNQPFGNLRTLPIEFVRAVTRFAEQDKARIAHQIQERIVVVSRAGQRFSRFVNTIGQRAHAAADVTR
jgi:hypothetical protein